MTIRSSVRDVETSLCISVLLVVLVVFLFLREVWATIIPSVAVPLSLVGTFGVMYLAGYTIDNLSLMALTVATGFVVDDAIVVIENITRYLEMGMRPYDAAMKGSKEIGFTVLSMSLSLIAVFTPILAHGRRCGQAVPRVRDDAVGSHCCFDVPFADHDADALRAIPQVQGRAETWGDLSLQREGIQLAAR